MDPFPTHVGEPTPTRSRRRTAAVYPRSRGATIRASAAIAGGTGPSPLTRGNHPLLAGQRGQQRSIPAHAGQPRSTRRWRPACRVYPRSRGATTPALQRPKRPRGPSPLTRCNWADFVGRVVAVGSIPAHAGQPTPVRSYRAETRVHPRSRGATVVCCKVASLNGGPSPLTRGNPVLHPEAAGLQGSIPAHAGQPWPTEAAG